MLGEEGGGACEHPIMAMHVHKDNTQHTTLSRGKKAKRRVYRNPQNVQ